MISAGGHGGTRVLFLQPLVNSPDDDPSSIRPRRHAGGGRVKSRKRLGPRFMNSAADRRRAMTNEGVWFLPRRRRGTRYALIPALGRAKRSAPATVTERPFNH